MNLSGDLDIFLADFGVAVIAGEVSGLGLKDEPDDLIGSDIMVVSTKYSVQVKTSLFSGLKAGDAISVDGTNFKVKENLKVGDGLLSRITLEET